MSYRTYILQRATSGRYYCGSSEDVARRLSERNDPNYYGSRTTKRFESPWDLVGPYESATRAEAMGLEKKIKKRGSRRFLDGTKHDNGESLGW